LFYLKELHRVGQPGAMLFLTFHGRRAAQRAKDEDRIGTMLAIPRSSIVEAYSAMLRGHFSFTRYDTNSPATDGYEYGVTFTRDNWIRQQCGALFTIVNMVPGAIYDFQDIVALQRM